MKWNRLITLAHERANQLSIREVKLLSENVLEAEIIQKMAGDIFREIVSLPEPKVQ